jgi:hypothetical protein
LRQDALDMKGDLINVAMIVEPVLGTECSWLLPMAGDDVDVALKSLAARSLRQRSLAAPPAQPSGT